MVTMVTNYLPLSLTIESPARDMGVEKGRLLGEITIEVLRADNLSNKEMLNKSDPYAQVELGGVKQKTKAKSGKLSPEWNKTFKMEAYEIDEYSKSKNPISVNPFRIILEYSPDLLHKKLKIYVRPIVMVLKGLNPPAHSHKYHVHVKDK
eukprot:sb/3473578/